MIIENNMHPMFGSSVNYIPGLENMVVPLEIQAETFVPTNGEDIRIYSEYQVTTIIKKTVILTTHLAYDKKNKEGVTLLHYGNLGHDDSMLFMKERLLLQGLNHKNVIEFYGLVYQPIPGREYLSFETYECYLSQLLSDKYHELLEPPVVKCVMQQLLTGLQYLHDKEIVHRDISSKNLVIKENGLVKITNFRSSLNLSESKTALQTEDYSYQPVNVLLEDESFHTADDIWSATCVFAEMVLKKKLLQSVGHRGLLKEIFLTLGFPDETKWPEFVELPDYRYLVVSSRPSINWLNCMFFEEQSLDLVKRGFQYNPKERIVAEELLLHPYFSGQPLAIDTKSFGLKLHGKKYKFPVK